MFKEESSTAIDAKISYRNWIEQLTNGGTAYPDLKNNTTFGSEYNNHLSKFKIYGHSDYNGTAILQSLSPLVLKKFFDGNIGANCID